MLKSKRVIWTWMKWGAVFLCVAAIVLMVYVWIAVQNIQAQKETGFERSEQAVIDETDISAINDIHAFHEATSYHIVFGSTDDGDQKIAFVPLEDDRNLTVLNQDALLTKQSMLKEWRQSCDACELIRIQPAMIETTALWELTYRDQNGRYVLDYMTMADGEQYEQMRFKQRFK
ncbi:hypothetical protein JNUCC1_03682 [Lentibacillus sp. JNUCC-1]|uniref:cell wall elongation regulator TseB-like domain-containing protein n=1 Tax=Lentibacillus sp. JNUCC-1 TaxID=2654513 RepID=UPI0012E90649|nr:DUF5590 domain-containing protein [Lentibacillus sp. JNUCC-1]MUV39798.1 hypothetical protein [Lentibacillus sp. JNUCC-1]